MKKCRIYTIIVQKYLRVTVRKILYIFPKKYMKVYFCKFCARNKNTYKHMNSAEKP